MYNLSESEFTEFKNSQNKNQNRSYQKTILKEEKGVFY
jgi:hypothetical protein